MEEKRITPLKAIRLKCLDCCCGSSHEVKLCTAERCPLFPFRDGHNPFKRKREYTPEEKAAIAARLAKNRPSTTMAKNQNEPTEGTYIPQIKTAEDTQTDREKSDV